MLYTYDGTRGMQTDDPSSQDFQRAQLLIELRRYAEAEKLLGAYLARFPQDAHAHALLAHALLAHALSHQPGRAADALREARAVIGCDPNLAEGYYLVGLAQFGAHPAEAQKALENALRIDPRDPRFYNSLARLHLLNDRLPEALEMALAGRRVNPFDVTSANMQAVALMRLGRKAEAAGVIHEALALDPENAQAHAQRGWMLLGSQPELARVSFGQALRIDPRLDHAREGLVESMKARWPFYARVLRGMLWLKHYRVNKKSWLPMAVVFTPPAIGLLLVNWFPTLGLVLMSWLPLCFSVLVLAQLSSPFFDLLLFMDPYARLTLTRDQIIRSRWVLASPLIMLLTILAMVVTNSPQFGAIIVLVLLVIARLLIGSANGEERKDPMRPG